MIWSKHLNFTLFFINRSFALFASFTGIIFWQRALLGFLRKLIVLRSWLCSCLYFIPRIRCACLFTGLRLNFCAIFSSVSSKFHWMPTSSWRRSLTLKRLHVECVWMNFPEDIMISPTFHCQSKMNDLMNWAFSPPGVFPNEDGYKSKEWIKVARSPPFFLPKSNHKSLVCSWCRAQLIELPHSSCGRMIGT